MLIACFALPGKISVSEDPLAIPAVDPIQGRLTREHASNFFAGLAPQIVDGLLRVPARMVTDYRIFQRDKRVVGGRRLLLEHIQTRPKDPVFSQCTCQRFAIDKATARGIDED